MTVRTWIALPAVVLLVGLGARAGRSAAAIPTASLRPQAVLATDRLLMLAANRSRAAVVTTTTRGCGAIVVWTAPAHRLSRFRLGELGCNFDGVDELALGHGQVAWLEAGGGNDLELTVMSGRLPRGRTKQLDYQVNGDRAGEDPTGGWAGNLVGAGSLLAYNRWTVVCERPAGEECSNGDPQARPTHEQLVRIDGGHTSTTRSGTDTYPLVAAGGGRFAIVQDGGVATITARGEPRAFVRDSGAPPRTVGLTSSTLLVERAAALDLYDAGTGESRGSIALGTAAPLALAGVSEGYALLAGPRRLVLVRLRDGALVELKPGVSSFVGARLTVAGLFYAYNPTSRRGRIGFVPARTLARTF